MNNNYRVRVRFALFSGAIATCLENLDSWVFVTAFVFLIKSLCLLMPWRTCKETINTNPNQTAPRRGGEYFVTNNHLGRARVIHACARPIGLLVSSLKPPENQRANELIVIIAY